MRTRLRVLEASRISSEWPEFSSTICKSQHNACVFFCTTQASNPLVTTQVSISFKMEHFSTIHETQYFPEWLTHTHTHTHTHTGYMYGVYMNRTSFLHVLLPFLVLRIIICAYCNPYYSRLTGISL